MLNEASCTLYPAKRRVGVEWVGWGVCVRGGYIFPSFGFPCHHSSKMRGFDS